MTRKRKSSSRPVDVRTDRSATSRGDTSRTQILRAAIGLLGSGGYGALSIGTVCEVAKISPTSLYWHFGDKSGLMSAMLRHVQQLDSEIYLSELERAKTMSEKFDAGVNTVRRMVRNDPENSWVVWGALWEGRYAAPEIVPLITEARRRQVEYFRIIPVEHFGLEKSNTIAILTAAVSAQAAMSWHQTKDEKELESILASLRRLWQLTAGWSAASAKDRRAFAKLPAPHTYGYAELIQGLD